MKSHNTIDTLFLLPLLAVAFGFLVPAVLAQSESPQNPNSQATTTAQKSAAPESRDARHSDLELNSLQEEIDGALNEQERERLRLKLVGQLVAKGMKRDATLLLQSMSDEERFNPQGLYNIANAQARLGDSEGAVRSYRKAIDQRKGWYSRAANNLGVVLMRLGRWEESYDALLSALRQESFRYAEASYNLGRLYTLRGETDLAVREWRRALVVDPQHAAATKALANAGSGGNITVASRPTKSSPKTQPERAGDALGGHRGGAMRSSESDGRAGTKEAEEAPKGRSTSKTTSLKSRPSAAPAFTLDPDTYNFLQRGREARERGRHDDAVENYRRVLRRMGGYFPPANLELGYTLVTLKRNDEAMASLLPVTIRNGEQFPISYYHVARLYELSEQLKLAEEYYWRAAESYKESNSQFLLDLSRVREKMGNLSGALASLEDYLKTVGQKPEWSDERLAELRLKLAGQPKQ